jgi:hypothetical protein
MPQLSREGRNLESMDDRPSLPDAMRRMIDVIGQNSRAAWALLRRRRQEAG